MSNQLYRAIEKNDIEKAKKLIKTHDEFYTKNGIDCFELSLKRGHWAISALLASRKKDYIEFRKGVKK
jgi:hypothetical protein